MGVHFEQCIKVHLARLQPYCSNAGRWSQLQNLDLRRIVRTENHAQGSSLILQLVRYKTITNEVTNLGFFYSKYYWMKGLFLRDQLMTIAESGSGSITYQSKVRKYGYILSIPRGDVPTRK